MGQLTDQLHRTIDGVKAEAEAILGRVERGFAGAQARLQAVLATLVGGASAQLVQLSGSAVAQAFTAAPVGSPGAILAAAEAHLLTQLQALERPASDLDLPTIKALILAHFVAQRPAATDAPLNTVAAIGAALPPPAGKA